MPNGCSLYWPPNQIVLFFFFSCAGSFFFFFSDLIYLVLVFGSSSLCSGFSLVAGAGAAPQLRCAGLTAVASLVTKHRL